MKDILLAVFCFVTVSCVSSEPVHYPLYIRDMTFFVELADSPAKQTQGLMNRRSLAPNNGMLFVFSDSEIRRFWMRNTYINLSIAYIDAEGIIVDIFDMKALDETAVVSSRPVRYALELNAGRFEGIHPGDRVNFSAIPLR